MKKSALFVGIPIVPIFFVAFFFLSEFEQNVSDFSAEKPMSPSSRIVPDGLERVTLEGKLKPYDPPHGAPLSDLEPEFELWNNEGYDELDGHTVISLYNVPHYPENPERVKVTGYFDPNSPNFYDSGHGPDYVVYVEELVQLESINLENEFTVQELEMRHDQINEEHASLNDSYSYETINEEQYIQRISALRELELELYDDVRNHDFAQDDLVDYNYWYRGTLKYPSDLQQELKEYELMKLYPTPRERIIYEHELAVSESLKMYSTPDELMEYIQRETEWSLVDIDLAISTISDIDDRHENIDIVENDPQIWYYFAEYATSKNMSILFGTVSSVNLDELDEDVWMDGSYIAEKTREFNDGMRLLSDPEFIDELKEYGIIANDPDEVELARFLYDLEFMSFQINDGLYHIHLIQDDHPAVSFLASD